MPVSAKRKTKTTSKQKKFRSAQQIKHANSSIRELNHTVNLLDEVLTGAIRVIEVFRVIARKNEDKIDVRYVSGLLGSATQGLVNINNRLKQYDIRINALAVASNQGKDITGKMMDIFTDIDEERLNIDTAVYRHCYDVQRELNDKVPEAVVDLEEIQIYMEQLASIN